MFVGSVSRRGLDYVNAFIWGVRTRGNRGDGRMEADTIYIETAGGVRQTIRKMDHRYDFIVPVWEATDKRE
jgi:hypothetical protein